MRVVADQIEATMVRLLWVCKERIVKTFSEIAGGGDMRGIELVY
jgi:hypothetical protein